MATAADTAAAAQRGYGQGRGRCGGRRRLGWVGAGITQRHAAGHGLVIAAHELRGGVIDPTGLVHLGARDYDSSIGRFVSVDPQIDQSDPQQLQG